MELPANTLTAEHLRTVAQFYSRHAAEPGVFGRAYRETLARRLAYLLPASASVLEIGCGTGELLGLLPQRDVTGIDLSEVQVARARERWPHGTFVVAAGENFSLPRTFDAVIVSDTLNLAADVQCLLEQVHRVCHCGTRLILNFQNHLWRPALDLAAALGLKQATPTNNWLSRQDVVGLLGLTQWQVIHWWQTMTFPLPLGVVSRWVNRLVTPVLRPLGVVVFVVARPGMTEKREEASVSVIVPARNERGTIAEVVARLPDMGAWTELLFVEGHSDDGTWAEIQRVMAANPERRIRAIQQTGRGKGNAVRDGFAEAQGDVLMILDADLAVPPEELPKFYRALVSGRTEFANGSRLVYPMERRAMRFLNMCANKAFGWMFSWLLGQPVKDTLCGTKALWKADYQKIAASRVYFGDFDPFGDFDLLFGASRLSLKIADIPIRYRERVYGRTNIRRWRHGWLLLRMVVFAARKMKFVD